MNYKTYIINLDKDTDRLSYMSSQLTSLGLSFERFPAILGSAYDFSNEYNESLCIEKNGKPMNTGELGCALSHRNVYKKMLKEGAEYALIFEDDICIKNKDFKHILDRVISENSKTHTWDYLQFDYQKPGIAWIIGWANQVKNTFFIRKGVLTKTKHLLFSLIKIPAVLLFATYEGLRNTFFTGPVSFHRDVYFAGCYMITRKGAETLLALSDTLIYPADRIQNEAKRQLGLQVRYYSPLLAFQQRKRFNTNIGNSF